MQLGPSHQMSSFVKLPGARMPVLRGDGDRWGVFFGKGWAKGGNEPCEQDNRSHYNTSSAFSS